MKLFAVEKNPNAAVTLRSGALLIPVSRERRGRSCRHRNATEWDGEVLVVEKDMRDVGGDIKADIVVSELLGSFGDNELSPECLDGALGLMAPGCVSIPASYRSFLAPLHSPKIHATVRDEMGRNSAAITGSPSANSQLELTLTNPKAT